MIPILTDHVELTLHRWTLVLMFAFSAGLATGLWLRGCAPRLGHTYLRLRSLGRAWWRVATRRECGWSTCCEKSRTVRIDRSEVAFALCALHALEGYHRGYWRDGLPQPPPLRRVHLDGDTLRGNETLDELARRCRQPERP